MFLHLISHWSCVLLPGFMFASLPLLSKCVWLGKFLFGDSQRDSLSLDCFPSQRFEFAFVSLIIGCLFLPTALAFQSPLFYSGIEWCPQHHPDRACVKKQRVPRVAVIGVKIARTCLWDIALFCLPQNHTDNSWCHRRGQGRQKVRWESRTILLTPPTKAEGAALLSTNLPLLLHPRYFLQKSKNQICLHFWETTSFFSDAIRLKHCLLYTFLNIPPFATFHSHFLGFVMIWIVCSLTVIRLKY